MNNRCMIKIISVFIIIVMIFTSVVDLVFAQEQTVSVIVERIITTDFPTVEAFVSIYDQDQLQISGLSRENVTLFEDDQLIDNFSFFREVNLETPLAIALLIDTTGSMFEGEPRPLDNVIDAAKDFINTLQPHDSVGIISFSEEITVEQGLTTEKSILLDALDRLEGVGDTPLYDAIYQGIDLVRDSEKRRVVILITDGVESGRSEKSLEEIIEFGAQWKVPIYSIGFGSSIISPQGNIALGSRLDEISRSTGGFDQIFQDSSNLSMAFNNINQFIRRVYHITYTSNLPTSSNEHQLSIELSLAGTTYSDTKTFVPNPLNLEIISPLENDLLSIETVVSVEASSTSNISQVQFMVDNEVIETLSEPTQAENIFEFTWDLLEVAPGEYEVLVIAYDVIGNTNQETLSVFVREPIIISIINPADGEQLVRVPIIEVELDTILDVSSATLMLNNNELATFTESTFSQQWPAQAFERGLYRITVDVVDQAGNRASKEINVRVGDMPVGAEFLEGLSEDESGFLTQGTLLLLILGGGAILIMLLLIIIPLVTKKNKSKTPSTKQGKPKPSMEEPDQMQGRPDVNQLSQTGRSLFLQEIHGIAPDTLWPLDKDEIHLGRKRDENDIHLQGAGASRRMAIIRKVGNNFLIHALHPENPVFVNNHPVNQQVLLSPGDQIKLGESVFTVIERTDTP